MTPRNSADIARDVISTCPVCDGELRVARLNCTTCGTSIEGQFSVGRFSRLSREQLALLESFLRARGNLRELERELGISYPTVRNRVEALVRALGLSGGAELPVQESRPPAAVAGRARREILERLARHELSAEQAAAMLRGDAAMPPGEPAGATDQSPSGEQQP